MGLFNKLKTNKKEETVKIEKKKKENNEKKEIKEAEKEPQKPVKKERTGEYSGVLIKPLITERSSDLKIYNQYVFEVSNNTNKVEVKKAMENIYGVKAQKVHIIKVRGKDIRYGKTKGKTKQWKKAIVTLKKGDKIETLGKI